MSRPASAASARPSHRVRTPPEPAIPEHAYRHFARTYSVLGGYSLLMALVQLSPIPVYSRVNIHPCDLGDVWCAVRDGFGAGWCAGQVWPGAGGVQGLPVNRACRTVRTSWLCLRAVSM